MLEAIIPTDAVFSGDTSRPVPSGAVVLTPTIRADSHADELAFYQRLRDANRALRCDFFEGVVMKRADSSYPVQTRSAGFDPLARSPSNWRASSRTSTVARTLLATGLRRSGHSAQIRTGRVMAERCTSSWCTLTCAGARRCPVASGSPVPGFRA